MIGETLNALPGMIVSDYESLLDAFGSPLTLLVIALALVAVAAAELCIRGRRKPGEVA